MYIRKLCMQIECTVFDLISEYALISGHPLFPEILSKNFIVLHLCNVLSSYFKCFNYTCILYCPSKRFNLLMWHFCYTVHDFFIYRIIMFYTTISLMKYLCMWLFVVAIMIATALQSYVSKAETTVLYLSSCIMYTCQNKYVLPSFPHMQRSPEVAFCTRDRRRQIT